MKRKKMSILIVGCGGVGSLAARILHTSVKCALAFCDGDVFEKGNLNRQTFDKGFVGKNKAESMSKYYGGDYYPYYITSAFGVQYDLILCCVDNHKARRTCIELATRWSVPCIVAANEVESSQVYIHYGNLVRTQPWADVMTWFPELSQDNEEERDPAHSCATAVKVEGNEQTFLANVISASLACQAIVRLINLLSHIDMQYRESFDLLPAYYHACNGLQTYVPIGKVELIFPHIADEKELYSG